LLIIQQWKTRFFVISNQEKVEQYFQSKKLAKEKFLLLTIGIPGSGKSFYLKQYSEHFVTISSDDIRQEILKEAKDKNQKMLLRGEYQEPDPWDAKHVFAPELRDVVFKKIDFLFDEALSQSKSILLDITNVSLQRVYYMMKARKFAYQVDGFYFLPKDLKQHLENIQKRVEKGGLDLAPKCEPNKEARREKIIRSVLSCFKVFSEDLQINPDYKNLQNPEQIWLDPAIWKYDGPSYAKFLDSLDAKSQRILDVLKNEDIFNHIIKLS